nr:MAG TPA: hypothetical protein [Bacteriophage sp.]
MIDNLAVVQDFLFNFLITQVAVLRIHDPRFIYFILDFLFGK